MEREIVKKRLCIQWIDATLMLSVCALEFEIPRSFGAAGLDAVRPF